MSLNGKITTQWSAAKPRQHRHYVNCVMSVPSCQYHHYISCVTSVPSHQYCHYVSCVTSVLSRQYHHYISCVTSVPSCQYCHYVSHVTTPLRQLCHRVVSVKRHCISTSVHHVSSITASVCQLCQCQASLCHYVSDVTTAGNMTDNSNESSQVNRLFVPVDSSGPLDADVRNLSAQRKPPSTSPLHKALFSTRLFER